MAKKIRLARSTGYKQTAEHIKKRIQRGPCHGNWVGENVSTKGGRTRALRLFVAPNACEKCGKNARLDRHHKDNNTANNSKQNIAFLCRKCHMTADRRINRMSEVRYGRKMS